MTVLEPSDLKKPRAATLFIILTVTVDMLAVGMILPVIPSLITKFTHGNIAVAAQTLGFFGILFVIAQLVFSPLLGALSDQFGRKPIILLSNVGLGLDCLFLAWAPALGWLYLGRIISAVTASSVPTAMSYMADLTIPAKRAAGFGAINAGLGVGFILGPAIGGVLSDINPRLPFCVAGVLCLFNALYGLLFLPESLASHHRSPFSWKRANPVASFSMLRSSKRMAGLSLMLLIAYITQQSTSVYVMYVDYRYHWMHRSVGFSLAAAGLLAGIYSMTLVKRLISKVGERGTILIGVLGGALGYLILGSANTGGIACLAIPVFSLTWLIWPVAQSLMSRQTSSSEQGQLQGAINVIRQCGDLIGTGLFPYIFSKSIGPGSWIEAPGLAFFVAFAILMVALGVAERATRPASV